jgi:hypothetical protein
MHSHDFSCSTALRVSRDVRNRRAKRQLDGIGHHLREAPAHEADQLLKVSRG